MALILGSLAPPFGRTLSMSSKMSLKQISHSPIFDSHKKKKTQKDSILPEYVLVLPCNFNADTCGVCWTPVLSPSVIPKDWAPSWLAWDQREVCQVNVFSLPRHLWCMPTCITQDFGLCFTLGLYTVSSTLWLRTGRKRLPPKLGFESTKHSVPHPLSPQRADPPTPTPQAFIVYNCGWKTVAAAQCSHSLAEIEEDVSSSGALAANVELCGFLYMLVIVAEPHLLLDVIHIIDIVACTHEHKIQLMSDIEIFV